MWRLVLRLSLLLWLCAPFAAAQAPVCLYQDLLSGPASGGEGVTDGVYVSAFGFNFSGATVKVNGTSVAQIVYNGPDVTGNRTQLGVQVSHLTAGTGHIVITTTQGVSTCPSTFTVTAGNIYFVGSGIDNDNAGAVGSNCAALAAGTAGDGLGGSGTFASPWKLTSTPSTELNGGGSNVPPPTGARTLYMYYHCMSTGDTLVLLNGLSYPWADSSGLYTSLALNRNISTSSSFFTFMARPGATVQLGGTGFVTTGIRDYADTYTVISGIGATGSQPNGEAIGFATAAAPFIRVVGNSVTCPDCSGSAAAIEGGLETDTNVGIEVLGNLVSNVGCSDSGGASNKQYHGIYVFGNQMEVGWNKIGGSSGCEYNGIQVNFGPDNGIGYGNFSLHDNDISYANGAGINISSMDPTQGAINIYNNIIHHVGLAAASDGSSFHACISSPGEAPSAGSGSVNVYNNTMWDCSGYLNSTNDASSCAVYMAYETAQTGLTLNLVNNILAQPSYTNTGTQNVYACGPATSQLGGSHNLWFTAAACAAGCTTLPLTVGTIGNPLFASTVTPGPWQNVKLQTGSPAIGAGTASLTSVLDFQGATRPGTPAIGALEYGSSGTGIVWSGVKIVGVQ